MACGSSWERSRQHSFELAYKPSGRLNRARLGSPFRNYANENWLTCSPQWATDSHGFCGSSWSSRAATKLVFLAFSLRPSRLRGVSAVPHSPPRRKEHKESANKNSFQPAKDLRPGSTDQRIRVDPSHP